MTIKIEGKTFAAVKPMVQKLKDLLIAQQEAEKKAKKEIIDVHQKMVETIRRELGLDKDLHFELDTEFEASGVYFLNDPSNKKGASKKDIRELLEKLGSTQKDDAAPSLFEEKEDETKPRVLN